MENKVIPEVFPTISVGSKYGEHVDCIDIDISKITEILKDAGLTDKQIMGLNITISDEVQPTYDGKFTSITGRKISTYGIDYLSKYTKEEVSVYLSNVLRHELQHFIDSYDKKLKKEDLEHSLKSILTTKYGIYKTIGIIASMQAMYHADLLLTNREGLTIYEVLGIGALSVLGVNTLQNKFFPKGSGYQYRNDPKEKRAFATKGQATSLIQIS